jgi:hypothetical protein
LKNAIQIRDDDTQNQENENVRGNINIHDAFSTFQPKFAVNSHHLANKTFESINSQTKQHAQEKCEVTRMKPNLTMDGIETSNVNGGPATSKNQQSSSILTYFKQNVP